MFPKVVSLPQKSVTKEVQNFKTAVGAFFPNYFQPAKRQTIFDGEGKEAYNSQKGIEGKTSLSGAQVGKNGNFIGGSKCKRIPAQAAA